MKLKIVTLIKEINLEAFTACEFYSKIIFWGLFTLKRMLQSYVSGKKNR